MNWDTVLWVGGAIVVIAAVIYGWGKFVDYEERRAAARQPLHRGGRPDPSDLIPTRAEREEAEKRYQWLLDHPGEIPPWERPVAPKNSPPPKVAP